MSSAREYNLDLNNRRIRQLIEQFQRNQESRNIGKGTKKAFFIFPS